MGIDREGNITAKSSMKVSATETTKTVTFTIPKEEEKNVTAALLKKNHMRNMYEDFFTLNQEFLSYVVSCNLTKTEYKMLFFMMAEMDMDNKVLVNNDYLIQKLNATKMTVINAIKKLVERKIIVRQKIGTQKYEIEVKYDMLNPLIGFKNKASKKNVTAHKNLMQQETPYILQHTTDGYIEYITNDGEVFKRVKDDSYLENPKITIEDAVRNSANPWMDE